MFYVIALMITLMQLHYCPVKIKSPAAPHFSLLTMLRSHGENINKALPVKKRPPPFFVIIEQLYHLTHCLNLLYQLFRDYQISHGVQELPPAWFGIGNSRMETGVHRMEFEKIACVNEID